MQIDPETLKKLRKTKGFSQQTLADASGVAKKTIARIETGKGEPRGATVQELAKALRVKPKVLAQKSESDAVRDEELRKHGFRQIKLYLHSETVLAYDLVKDRYGVDMRSIVDAAPMLFTLLAEMSLADRRRRLKEAETAWGAFEQAVPEYIRKGWWWETGSSASSWFHDGEQESESIAKGDLFGRLIEEGQLFKHYGNPFSDFLIQLAKGLGPDNDAIDHEEICFDPDSVLGIPFESLFKAFRESLTGGASRADYALSHGSVRIGQIPQQLRGEDEEDEHVVSERVKWLEAQVPDDDWAEHERLTASIENSNRSITNEPPSEGDSEDA